jgi:hypothetical protein
LSYLALSKHIEGIISPPIRDLENSVALYGGPLGDP